MRIAHSLLAGALASFFTIGVAQADIIVLRAALTSAAENNPANNSPGLGEAIVILDTVTGELKVKASFSGLQGTTTAAHIHGPVVPPALNAGVMTQVPLFEGFPTGVTSGTYQHVFDIDDASFYNPGFLSGQDTAAKKAAF